MLRLTPGFGYGFDLRAGSNFTYRFGWEDAETRQVAGIIAAAVDSGLLCQHMDYDLGQ